MLILILQTCCGKLKGNYHLFTLAIRICIHTYMSCCGKLKGHYHLLTLAMTSYIYTYLSICVSGPSASTTKCMRKELTIPQELFFEKYWEKAYCCQLSLLISSFYNSHLIPNKGISPSTAQRKR